MFFIPTQGFIFQVSEILVTFYMLVHSVHDNCDNLRCICLCLFGFSSSTLYMLMRPITSEMQLGKINVPWHNLPRLLDRQWFGTIARFQSIHASIKRMYDMLRWTDPGIQYLGMDQSSKSFSFFFWQDCSIQLRYHVSAPMCFAPYCCHPCINASAFFCMALPERWLAQQFWH